MGRVRGKEGRVEGWGEGTMGGVKVRVGDGEREGKGRVRGWREGRVRGGSRE